MFSGALQRKLRPRPQALVLRIAAGELEHAWSCSADGADKLLLDRGDLNVVPISRNAGVVRARDAVAMAVHRQIERLRQNICRPGAERIGLEGSKQAEGATGATTYRSARVSGTTARDRRRQLIGRRIGVGAAELVMGKRVFDQGGEAIQEVLQAVDGRRRHGIGQGRWCTRDRQRKADCHACQEPLPAHRFATSHHAALSLWPRLTGHIFDPSHHSAKHGSMPHATLRALPLLVAAIALAESPRVRLIVVIRPASSDVHHGSWNAPRKKASMSPTSTIPVEVPSRQSVPPRPRLGHPLWPQLPPWATASPRVCPHPICRRGLATAEARPGAVST